MGAGTVNPDHVRAKIAEQHGAEGRGSQADEFHDLNAAQRPLCLNAGLHGDLSAP
jgi:hypothetical protein